jgi:hypothetical protein
MLGENDEGKDTTGTGLTLIGISSGLILSAIINDSVRSSAYPKTVFNPKGKVTETNSKGFEQCGEPTPATNTKVLAIPALENITKDQILQISLSGKDTATGTIPLDNKLLQERFRYREPFAKVYCEERETENCTPQTVTLSPDIAAKYVLHTGNQIDLEKWLELHPDHEKAPRVKAKLEEVKRENRRQADRFYRKAQQSVQQETVSSYYNAKEALTKCLQYQEGHEGCQALQSKVDEGLSKQKPTRMKDIVFEKEGNGYVIFVSLQNDSGKFVRPEGDVGIEFQPYQYQTNVMLEMVSEAVTVEDYRTTNLIRSSSEAARP